MKFYDKFIKKKNSSKRESFKAHSNYAFIGNNQNLWKKKYFNIIYKNK